MTLGIVASAHAETAGPAVLLTETWTGTNGAAWNSTNWPTQRDTLTGGGTSTIQSNQGQLAGGGAPAAFTAIDVTDFELLVKMSCASSLTGTFPEIGWRIGANITSSDPNNGYVIQGTGNNVNFQRINSYATVASAAATELNAAVTAWFRVRVVGTNHKIRWWIDGAGEPGTWQIDATDANYTTGRLMFRTYSATAVLFDNLTVTDP